MAHGERVQGAHARVSVVIPTYDYADRIEVTVHAVLDDPATHEVIVGIDGCQDGTLEVLEAMRATDRRVVPLPLEHGGKAAALDSALQHATGEVVLLLDQDVVAGPGLVSGHAGHHANGDHLVVVGYMPTVAGERQGAISALAAMYAAEYESHCRGYEMDPDSVLTRLWGGNVSLRLDDCRRVGVDFAYFGHEDQEFGLRCLESGLTGRFDRALCAEHRHARDGSAFVWYSKMQGASRWQIQRTHPHAVPPADADSVLEGLPAPLRALARLVGTPRLGDPVAGILMAAGTVAGRIGWHGPQVAAYRFARRVALRTGFLLAAAGREDLLERRFSFRPSTRPSFHRAGSEAGSEASSPAG